MVFSGGTGVDCRRVRPMESERLPKLLVAHSPAPRSARTKSCGREDRGGSISALHGGPASGCLPEILRADPTVHGHRDSHRCENWRGRPRQVTGGHARRLGYSSDMRRRFHRKVGLLTVKNRQTPSRLLAVSPAGRSRLARCLFVDSLADNRCGVLRRDTHPVLARKLHRVAGTDAASGWPSARGGLLKVCNLLQ